MIRNCAEDDLAEIVKLEKKSFEHPYDLGTFAYFLSSDHAVFLVYDVEGSVEGYVICDISSRKKGIVVSIAVSPEHRRKGLGSSLLEAAMSRMRGRVSELELQVARSDEGAVQFYEAHGFLIEGTLPDYYADGEDAYLMVRKL
ncbi:MAG TPA: GNAT family N-acetyltransferase [Thermoproteota archaeon]|nr:GNAT family N-acetyltransferase [Thermoproteota archaeon]